DISGYGGVYSSITQAANGAKITFTDGGFVTLIGFQATNLTSADFITGPVSPPPPPPPPPPPGVFDRTLTGTNGFNIIEGDGRNELIQGLVGNDTLYGMGGNDQLEGGDGADYLYGGEGDDIIIGGAHSDQLYGGAGADRFVFSTGDGPNNIHDFQDGIDLIDISGYGGVYSSITQAANG
ncbi:hypothetical protein GVN21_20355, partial [Caulobacter sp. SLTY]|nr:hypothetical protein [Caulobacter sp. SLTY]